jgi:phospholipase/lecithinase/hemolysin
MRGHVVVLSSLALTLPFLPAVADTLPVNQIAAFGDSLTDTGNASIATLGAQPGAGYAYRNIPGVPFQVGEFANPPAPGGPSGLWIDQFASKAGLPDPAPALAPSGGTNYAVGGALTGSNGIGYVTDQLNYYFAHGPAVSSSTLYSFWAGANDIISGNSPVTAADNIEANIATLAGDGGKYFLWFNLPLLGNVPAGAGDSGPLNAASTAFDAEWSKDIQSLEHEFPGIVLVGVDIEALTADIAADPGKYGFTGLVEPQGDALNGYVFSFDGLHPTSYADQFIADLALTDFEAAITPTGPTTVPEPASAALLLLGAGVIAAAKLKAKYRG